MQSLIWSQNQEQYIWSDEIARLIVFSVLDFEVYVVRAYRDDGYSVPLAQFKTKLDALSFIAQTMLETNQEIPVDVL